ncbi:hypothetical protein OF820_07200 [Oceanotoga sp. DSM 15011]|jgi:hypothetical protein|uniref:Uncharacterized protein n=1 Tax=Oceanotoga teriensis TaxID=515440 RepID=A0AA45HI63_9BACT|nr:MULTISPECIES: hypothetical protein [Oceanotoga]MDN5341704.1 hypothetical protein [Oceanotoga sp.]MDO7976348.1 hypothetical protein [Oceanotoga teriensis]PWJ89283.1 hypothetical protein C7380_1159 [Oceanotoga teriensis]UYO98860.1 hypothetical protein OF820_07200 [Oceanotoga sp. DSM 15011]
MKKVITLLLITLMAVSAFSLKFGGGWPSVSYIPGDQLLNPIKDTVKLGFSEGIFAFGGGGMGRIGSGPIFLGGEGFDGYSSKKDKYKFSASYGAFLIGTSYDTFNFVSLDAGLGLGGFTQKIDVYQDGVNKDKEGFIDGSSPYINTISIDSFIVSPYIGITLKPTDFFGFFIKGKYTVGVSFDGWKFESGDRVKGLENKGINFYELSAGIVFGY